MNAPEIGLQPAVGRTDARGRLVHAEPRLLELVERAGGGLGSAVPVPELAGLERLARRLGIAITRAVVVADEEDDWDLSVTAAPDGDGVVLTVAGWNLRASWRGPDDRAGSADFHRTEGDWWWETDAALRFTHLSVTAGQRHGFDAAALLGQPLVRLFRLAGEDDLPILGTMAARLRFDGQVAELRGTGRRVQLSAEPLRDDRGGFAGFRGSATLIAEQTTAARDAALSHGLGEQLDRSLRRPLERIIAHASSMSAAIDGPLAPSYSSYADDIATAGRHLLGLVDDLVDLEAVEQPDFAVATETIDLADIARRAAGLLGVRAADADVRIERPGFDETLPAIGEFRRALQVLVNLIGNAVRYSPAGGVVWVRATRDGGRACVIVADQGKGIVAGDQELIFAKFGRVDPAEAGGSGLGLYISRRLARAMGGDLTVDSAPGEGARFIFTLPVAGG
ncbi:histidine kinase [Sphingomonas guangdongensis]|uniref:histidine kinase n=1 Tax=Sphingomonas guangdongensis TaxID=1141890 RepID=A0A285QYU2_9SPHN|nr:HAMP domain-containing sensor histidine kinase [Sphingomonas guangdongensis]SOB87011.1 histidine kinase [Sphingomonas guangdongensis]